jgi:hypothetical protein
MPCLTGWSISPGQLTKDDKMDFSIILENSFSVFYSIFGGYFQFLWSFSLLVVIILGVFDLFFRK